MGGGPSKVLTWEEERSAECGSGGGVSGGAGFAGCGDRQPGVPFRRGLGKCRGLGSAARCAHVTAAPGCVRACEGTGTAMAQRCQATADPKALKASPAALGWPQWRRLHEQARRCMCVLWLVRKGELSGTPRGEPSRILALIEWRRAQRQAAAHHRLRHARGAVGVRLRRHLHPPAVRPAARSRLRDSHRRPLPLRARAHVGSRRATGSGPERLAGTGLSKRERA